MAFCGRTDIRDVDRGTLLPPFGPAAGRADIEPSLANYRRAA